MKKMSINLILTTPDLTTGKSSPKKTITLNTRDYEGKNIKEVISAFAFRDVLKGQDPATAEQAIQLLFNFIYPKNISDADTWWEQSFESVIDSKSSNVIIDLEITDEGKEFFSQASAML
jgi:hypothetical protein